MRRGFRQFAQPSLNWLLLAVPAAVGLELAHRKLHAPWAAQHWIFLAAAVGVIPLSGWMGRATEQIAHRLGEGIGGLLNATFGNAAELIIAASALLAARRNPEATEQMHRIVKASLTGSIIGNLLLVLGLALLAGGLRHKVQRFNVTASRANATLLTLAAVALLLPDVFVHVAGDRGEPLSGLSLEVALVLLAAYALSLVFSLHTHRELYTGAADAPHATGEPPPAPPAASSSAPAAAGEPLWSTRRALAVLLAATAGVAILAELLIGSAHAAAARAGLNDVFVGVIVVAIVGNAAEHSTAVLVAWRNRLDLSLAIAVGSSIQIALFVAPLLLLLSHALGPPMTLVFTLPEVAAVAVSVWIVQQISGDGQSNWLEGVLLLMLYAILAAFFYNLP